MQDLLPSASLVMNTNSNAFEGEIKCLSPEILLKIFLNLDSHQTVMLRSVCKEFLEIIDNNKSLWRSLDWVQETNGSAVKALGKFDEKSASTLKEVSIFQKYGQSDDRILKVLDRSKNTLTDLSFKIRFSGIGFRLKLTELASNCHHLESLILWNSRGSSLSLLPKTRLTRSSRQPYLGTERSSNLQVLWCFDLVKNWNENLDVSSLVSFADESYCDSLQLRSVISNFSQTIVHLSISGSGSATTSSLSCSSLRILEGRFFPGFPSWLDAPSLRIVIASSVSTGFLRELPISVEELWLLCWSPTTTVERSLDFLSQVCPHLKVLKLGKDFFVGDRLTQQQLGSKDVSSSFTAREEKVREGVEIEGIKMVSLEKLIVPIELFKSAEADQLRDLVGEVIDLEDYPDFIELEY